MALETFKAQLKAKARTLGVNLSQKRIDAIADRLHKKNPDLTEVADHDARIDDFHELQPLDEIARTDDRLRTLEKPKPAAKPKAETTDDDDNDEPGNNPKPKKDDEVPAWAKELIGTVQTLAKEKTLTTIKSKVADKLKDKGIPDSFYKRWTLPEKDEDVDQFVQDIESDWKELKQTENNQGLQNSSGAPAGSRGGGKAGEVDSDLLNFSKRQNEKAVAGQAASK